MKDLRPLTRTFLVLLVACGSSAATTGGTDATSDQFQTAHPDASDQVAPQGDDGVGPAVVESGMSTDAMSDATSDRLEASAIPGDGDACDPNASGFCGGGLYCVRTQVGSGTGVCRPGCDSCSPPGHRCCAISDHTTACFPTNDVPPTAGSCATITQDAGGGDGGSICASAADCRIFSDYCGGCVCDVLGVSEPNPVCDAGTVSCFVDPCMGRMAACDTTGHCVVH